jgi:Intracellular proteinase inhibitor
MRGGHRAALAALLVIGGPHVPAGGVSPLAFTISVPTPTHVGASVPIVLRLHNASDRPHEAHFLGRTIVFDIVVARVDGTIVWRRLERDVGPSILQVHILKPGETMQWRDTWLPREPGHYRVQGILPSDAPEPLRTPWTGVDVSP